MVCVYLTYDYKTLHMSRMVIHSFSTCLLYSTRFLCTHF